MILLLWSAMKAWWSHDRTRRYHRRKLAICLNFFIEWFPSLLTLPSFGKWLWWVLHLSDQDWKPRSKPISKYCAFEYPPCPNRWATLTSLWIGRSVSRLFLNRTCRRPRDPILQELLRYCGVFREALTQLLHPTKYFFRISQEYHDLVIAQIAID
jgi:hypothetical protein